MSNIVKWSLDPSHSELQFKVKHLVISTVTGSFKNFDASLQSNGEDFSGASVSLQADIASIDTGNSQRDEHLRSADFFDASNFPTMTFEASSLRKIDTENYELSGNLSIRGVSKPVQLNAIYGGAMKDPWGNDRVGFEVSGKINRKDFGLTWSAVTETGGLVVSDEVKIIANVEFIKGKE
jgi:polyisoprenoid-binding protein YceI